MADQIMRVSVAPAGSAVANWQRERLIALSFNDVLTRLRSAILETDLWLLNEIDPQALLHRGGYEIPAARQLLFFHPRLMVRLLAGDSAAILEAPLKFAVLEEEGGTRLRWLDPVMTFAKYDNDALTDLGKTLAIECERIVDRVFEDIPHAENFGLALL